MRKLLREFRWWIVSAVAIIGAAHIVAHEQHRASAKYQDHRTRYCAALGGTAKEQIACKEEKYDAKSDLPWWAILYTWPEGMTVWAIIGTGFIIAWQSSETRKSAKATQDSVIVQEVAYKQWVEIDTWENKTPHLQPTVKNPEVRLTFQITNYTSHPFTLESAASQKGAANTVQTMKHIVSPNGWYLGDISFPLTIADLDVYQANRLAVTVVIDTTIRTVLEKRRADHFVHTILLGPSRCDMTEVQHTSEGDH
jgi:hypothetical protein